MLVGAVLAVCFSGGGLDGTIIVLSPGHGLYRHDQLGWTTQRPPTGGLVEDFETADTVFAFLLPYLRRAGADVWPLRCECPSAVEVVLDDSRQDFEARGPWEKLNRGFAGSALWTQGGQNALACFRPMIPQSGRMPLYLRYPKPPGKAGTAVVRVVTAAGIQEISIDQSRFFGLWRYVGTYYFFAGRAQRIEIRPAGDGSITVDALRIGGGLSTESDQAYKALKADLLYDQGAAAWVRYSGAPPEVWHSSTQDPHRRDILCRPAFAEFLVNPTDRAVYLSYHTNAGGGRGTEVYRHKAAQDAETLRLARLIREELIGDLKQLWDPTWPDRGIKSADFAELRYLKKLPGVLIESAFHDNPLDLKAEKSPRWRRIVGRALYQALARYFGGDDTVLLPEPPQALCAFVRKGGVRLIWRPPAWGDQAAGAGAARSYRIHVSFDGLCFTELGKTGKTTAFVRNLPAGRPVFFRIVAENEGGSSLPSSVAGVLAAPEAPVRILLVNAFPDDTGVVEKLQHAPGGKAPVLRLLPGRSPSGGDRVVEHLWSLASVCPAAFRCDSVELKAFSPSMLKSYDAVFLICGTQRRQVLKAQLRSALLAYLRGGGKLLLSGAYLHEALSWGGRTPGDNFLGALGCTTSSNEPATSGQPGSVRIKARGPFISAGVFALGESNDLGLGAPRAVGRLNADIPFREVFTAEGATVGLAQPESYVVLTFPFECIPEAGRRAVVMEAICNALFRRELAQVLRSMQPSRRPAHLLCAQNDTVKQSGEKIAFQREFSLSNPDAVAAFVLRAWYRSPWTLYLNDGVLVQSSASRRDPSLNWVDCTERARALLRAGANRLVLEVGRGGCDLELHLFGNKGTHRVLVPAGSLWKPFRAVRLAGGDRDFLRGMR